MTIALGTTVRVWVPDVWDVVELTVSPDQTVAQLKAAALEQALGHGKRAQPGDFVVKYRGALVSDESQTLGALNLPDRAPMIVLAARRRPVT
jgi:hypothetical protein